MISRCPFRSHPDVAAAGGAHVPPTHRPLLTVLVPAGAAACLPEGVSGLGRDEGISQWLAGGMNTLGEIPNQRGRGDNESVSASSQLSGTVLSVFYMVSKRVPNGPFAHSGNLLINALFLSPTPTPRLLISLSPLWQLCFLGSPPE